MERTRFEQWAAWAGIAFAVLIIVAAGLMLAKIPDPEDPDAKIIEFYNDTTAHVLMIAGMYLWTFACMLFLFLLVHLRRVLGRAEGAGQDLSSVAFAAGLVFIILMMISAMAIVAPAGAIELGGSDNSLDPDYMRILPQFGFGAMRIGAAASAIVLIYCTSFISLRTGVLPRGTAWAGFLLAPFGLLLLTPVPMAAIPIWVLIVSIALLRSRPLAEAADR